MTQVERAALIDIRDGLKRISLICPTVEADIEKIPEPDREGWICYSRARQIALVHEVRLSGLLEAA